MTTGIIMGTHLYELWNMRHLALNGSRFSKCPDKSECSPKGSRLYDSARSFGFYEVTTV